MTWLSELVMRPTLNTISIPLNSYQATIWWKIFEIILNKDLNLWRGKINQVLYSCVSKWYTVQQLHTSSIICVDKFKKLFKVHLQSTQVWNTLKKFQSPVQVNWAWKFSKNFQSSTQVRPEWENFKKFQCFKCLVVKCQNF